VIWLAFVQLAISLKQSYTKKEWMVWLCYKLVMYLTSSLSDVSIYGWAEDIRPSQDWDRDRDRDHEIETEKRPKQLPRDL